MMMTILHEMFIHVIHGPQKGVSHEAAHTDIISNFITMKVYNHKNQRLKVNLENIM